MIGILTFRATAGQIPDRHARMSAGRGDGLPRVHEPEDADRTGCVGETGSPRRRDVEEQLGRILANDHFARSPRLSSFLRFVVEAKLDGHEARVQEYAIGIDVFDRGESFDPRVDSIVRVEAGRLRDRLSKYYAEEGREDPILISLPRRGYVPEFAPTGQTSAPESRLRVPVLRRFLGDPRIAWGAVLLIVAALGVQFLMLRPAVSSRDVIEFPIQPPSGGTLLTPLGGGGLAVSSDGKRLVYPARDETGVTSLYLRAVDRAQPERLADTENAAWPFWSPDSRAIGFGALEKLEILDLDRGETRTIANAPGYLGGTWSAADGGTIVIATAPGSLVRVPTTGGEQMEVPPFAPDEVARREPAFLPDGKRIIYTASRSDGSSEIRAADLETGHPVSVESASAGRYSQTDDGRHWLLIRQDSSLVARETNPTTLEPMSAPVTLAGGLPRVGMGGFAVAGSTLAYVQSTYPVSRNRLVWRSRSGRTLATLGEPNNYVYVGLSPDESTVAVAISTGRQTDIWTMDVETGVATRQTEDPELDRAPLWSPDGRQLLISTNRRGDESRMYVLAADGSAGAAPWLDYPLDAEFADWPSQWHRTSTVLFSRGADDGYDIWQQAAGSVPRPLIERSGSQINARLSPDERYVAYASDELGEWQVFLSTYPATGSRIRLSSAGGNYPLWSSDGTELYYVAPDGQIMATEIRREPPLSASLPVPLFRVRFPETPLPMVYQYAVSTARGGFLVVEEEEGPSATAVLNWERLLDR